MNGILLAWSILRVYILLSQSKIMESDITNTMTETALFRTEGKPKRACVLSSSPKVSRFMTLESWNELVKTLHNTQQ
jgi:hypothetical protein